MLHALPRRIYIAGTCDTKQAELRYAEAMIAARGVPAVVVDLSTGGEVAAGTGIAAAEVASHHPDGAATVFCGDRGRAVAAMAEAFRRFMLSRSDVAGLLGFGGSGGTALVTPAMRALPVGLPKLMVSTVAAGNVARYVGTSDVAMMPSVTDLAGLNRISRPIIRNAAHAQAGMVAGAGTDALDDKPAVGLTMFGVTTPCVTEAVRLLGAEYDALVFHATGAGGESIGKLAEDGLVQGVLDLTTTEVADYLVGGVFPCTADRFSAVARTRVPYVGSCGALDMVNFGAPGTVPAVFRDRLLYRHNPEVTLMRTTAGENVRIGTFIGKALSRCDGPVRLLLPNGGVSALDVPGQAFHDPAADAALFDALRRSFRPAPNRRLLSVPHAINDPAFAAAAVAAFQDALAEAANAAH